MFDERDIPNEKEDEAELAAQHDDEEVKIDCSSNEINIRDFENECRLEKKQEAVVFRSNVIKNCKQNR